MGTVHLVRCIVQQEREIMMRMAFMEYYLPDKLNPDSSVYTANPLHYSLSLISFVMHMGQMQSLVRSLVVPRVLTCRFRGNRICRGCWGPLSKVLTDESDDGLFTSEKTADPDRELLDALLIGHHVYYVLIIRYSTMYSWLEIRN